MKKDFFDKIQSFHLTFWEVLLSVGILTVGVIGLGPLFKVADYDDSADSSENRAIAIANYEIEKLLLLENSHNIPFVNTYQTTDDFLVLDRINYVREDGESSKNLIKIEVEVINQVDFMKHPPVSIVALKSIL